MCIRDREEERLKNKKYGSTKQGIAPFYSDKYQKKTVMALSLIHISEPTGAKAARVFDEVV